MYYLNSMEYTASCMEMEMISAKNIANIIKDKYLIKKHDDLWSNILFNFEIKVLLSILQFFIYKTFNSISLSKLIVFF